MIEGERFMEDSFVMEDEVFDEDIQNDPDEEIDNNKLMAYDIAVFYNTYNLSTLLKWWGNKLVVPNSKGLCMECKKSIRVC